MLKQHVPPGESVPERAGLGLHPLAGISRRRNAQARCLSLVDDTHPAAAEFFANAVVRDSLPHKLGGCAHSRNHRTVKGTGSMRTGKLQELSTLIVFLALGSWWSKRASLRER